MGIYWRFGWIPYQVITFPIIGTITPKAMLGTKANVNPYAIEDASY